MKPLSRIATRPHLLAGLLVIVAVASAPAVAEARYKSAATTMAWDTGLTLHSELSACNNCMRKINLPFTFRFYGKPFTSVWVSTNGFVTFGGDIANALPNNSRIEWTGTTATNWPIIAPFWDDFDTTGPGEIRYGSSGGHFTISWDSVINATDTVGTNSVSFQLKLFSDGVFELHYKDVSMSSGSNGSSATVGYGDALLGVAHQLAYNTTSLFANHASKLTPYSRPMYVGATDFLNKWRAGVTYRLYWGGCVAGQPAGSFTEATTIANGWVVLELASTCDQTWGSWVGGYPNQMVPGQNTVSKRKETPFLAANGQASMNAVYVHRDRGLTPAPFLTQNVSGGGQLVWWDDNFAMYPLLILPGFDPLNTDTPADVLAKMGDLAAQLINDGYDVAIPEFSNGNLTLEGFRAQVAQWVEMAHARSPTRRVQAIGISMGGVLLRDYLWNYYTIAHQKIRASYFVDAPLTGANLGSGTKGMITLATCYRAGEPEELQLNSPSARQLAFEHTVAGTCTCNSASTAAGSHCTAGPYAHDSYYNSIGWFIPPNNPVTNRYAFSFGDGDPTGGLAFQRPNASTFLYNFSVNGFYCGNTNVTPWSGNARDCAPGSTYIKSENVDTYTEAPYLWRVDIPICQGGGVHLGYRPAFINVDSALGFNVGWGNCTTGNVPPPVFTSASALTYSPWSAPANFFNGRYVNIENARHDEPPASLAILRDLVTAAAISAP